MRSAILVAILLITFNSAWAVSYGSFKGVVFHGCYDGDTCTFTIPGVHPLLGEKIKVRLRGVDAAEIRTKCDWEKKHAVRTRDFLIALLRESPRVDLVDVERGKYFRIIATVIAHGVDVGKVLIEKGWARAYEGGKRESWCAR